MTSKENITSTPNYFLVPAPNTGKEYSTKFSPTLDVSSTVLNLSVQDQTTILVTFPINTSVTDATNTPVDPTKALKTTVSNITAVIPFIIALIYHETQTVLPQMEDLKQELTDPSVNYK